jgi:hypothetical protein
VSKAKDGDAAKRKVQDVLRGTGDTAKIQRREGGRSVEQGLELAGVGGVAPEVGHGADSRAGARAAGAEADEKEAAAGAAGGGGGRQPHKTLPQMDPEEALRAFAESVGMPVERMWDRGEGGRKVAGRWCGCGRATRGDGGEIVEIDWNFKDLTGTLPVGDMHMPYLRRLILFKNEELKGEAEGGVGVTVVKFTDCFCE